MAPAGVAQVADADSAQAGPQDGEPEGHEEVPTRSKSSNKLERVAAVRKEIQLGAQRARCKCPWRHQVRVYDFYHDHGRRRPYVQTFVALLIVANFLCQAAQRQVDPNPDNEQRRHKTLWRTLDVSFNVVFLVELLVNMYGSWMWPFLREGWNVFDLFVVSIGVIDMLPVELPPSFKMVRLFRAFRVFRLFGRVESLKKILDSIYHALPGVLNALILGVIMMSIYAVLAVDCFHNLYSDSCSEESPGSFPLTARGLCYGDEYYGTFFSALYTLFQILTGESWSEAGVRPIFHFYQHVKRDDFSTVGTAVFFVSFILINSFIILNVIVAVLLDGMNTATAVDDEPVETPTDTKHAWAETVPEYVKGMEEIVRTMHVEVADLNGKMDALIRMQKEQASRHVDID